MQAVDLDLDLVADAKAVCGAAHELNEQMTDCGFQRLAVCEFLRGHQVFCWKARVALFTCLTPELSRTDLRPRLSDNLTALCRGREAGSA